MNEIVVSNAVGKRWEVIFGRTLSRHKSTIGREIKRNIHQKFNQYLPDTAQRKTDKRKTLNRKQRYVDKQPELKKKIIAWLEKGWSPDLIAGRLKRFENYYLNHESIYQFIYSLDGRKVNLRQHLRCSHRIRQQKKWS